MAAEMEWIEGAFRFIIVFHFFGLIFSPSPTTRRIGLLKLLFQQMVAISLIALVCCVPSTPLLVYGNIWQTEGENSIIPDCQGDP